MRFSDYLQRVEESIMPDVRDLCTQLINFGCVLIIVPVHLAILSARIIFPWFNPLIDDFFQNNVDNNE